MIFRIDQSCTTVDAIKFVLILEMAYCLRDVCFRLATLSLVCVFGLVSGLVEGIQVTMASWSLVIIDSMIALLSTEQIGVLMVRGSTMGDISLQVVELYFSCIIRGCRLGTK